MHDASRIILKPSGTRKSCLAQGLTEENPSELSLLVGIKSFVHPSGLSSMLLSPKQMGFTSSPLLHLSCPKGQSICHATDLSKRKHLFPVLSTTAGTVAFSTGKIPNPSSLFINLSPTLGTRFSDSGKESDNIWTARCCFCHYPARNFLDEID